MIRKRSCGGDPLGKRSEAAGVLQGIAGRDQPPDTIEADPLHGKQTSRTMRSMRRIKCAAKQPDAHAGRVRRQNYAGSGDFQPSPVSGRRNSGRRAWERELTIHGRQKQPPPPCVIRRPPFATTRNGGDENYGRVCPLPWMRYLKLVNCSTPTGPRACSLPVAMPISAPKPNSPPSANCVEALCRTIAESTSRRNFSAAFLSSVTIASVWWDP